MKTLILLALLAPAIFADIKQELYHLYQNKEFEKACSVGAKNFTLFRKNEELVSLYAFSCLKSDYIDRLAIPISALKYSPEARSNAAYFSIILMQKKLLYHALIDGYDISSLKLPTTDYVLSTVFDLFTRDDHSRKRPFYHYNDPNSPKLSYKLYITEKSKIKKMVIEEYYDTILANRHIYW